MKSKSHVYENGLRTNLSSDHFLLNDTFTQVRTEIFYNSKMLDNHYKTVTSGTAASSIPEQKSPTVGLSVTNLQADIGNDSSVSEKVFFKLHYVTSSESVVSDG